MKSLFLLLLMGTALAEVRIDMTRELPDETQHIVRIFEDREDFEMWLDMRLDDGGCDPYVTKMNITMDNSPNLNNN